ncbi:MAG TPA: head GIN domain-containing protein [Sphingopyxis sp.]|nr:head GIN domain-containing protein [Sphingopyxis sp.]HMP45475.1 head GIN domain-containing protein [Sphingopyxis sp.]HMQ20638.1 head GIN domain-containing protein [Sphingopyxis sp.]
MSMISRSAALAAALLLAAGPASAAEKRYGLTSFETIELQADVIVEVTTRAPVSAVASGPQDALDRLTVEARDGRLVIGQRQRAGDERRRAAPGPVVVRVNAANLRGATVAGAGSLRIDRLRGPRVDIGLRGPGRIAVDAVAADRLSVAMIGNGAITLAGSAKEAKMMLSGAGAVDAGALSVGELVSDSEGAGDHLLRAEKSATVTTRGVGKTVVLGKPVCTVRNAGSGTVECGAGK